LCDLGGENKNPGQHAHGNGHGHVRVYARLRHIRRIIKNEFWRKLGNKSDCGCFGWALYAPWACYMNLRTLYVSKLANLGDNFNKHIKRKKQENKKQRKNNMAA
jgi:hypothetical protein